MITFEPNFTKLIKEVNDMTEDQLIRLGCEALSSTVFGADPCIALNTWGRLEGSNDLAVKHYDGQVLLVIDDEYYRQWLRDQSFYPNFDQAFDEAMANGDLEMLEPVFLDSLGDDRDLEDFRRELMNALLKLKTEEQVAV